MRMLQEGLQSTAASEIQEFSIWIVQIGDGKLQEPNDGLVEIEIPEEFLISEFNDPIEAIVSAIYPNLIQKHTNESYLQCRAIWTSRIETVNEINQYMLSLILGILVYTLKLMITIWKFSLTNVITNTRQEKEYLNCDSVDETKSAANDSYNTITSEFLNSLSTSGLPNHRIKLKIGAPIMLLRNLDQAEGLCNGSRLIITRLANHVIELR